MPQGSPADLNSDRLGTRCTLQLVPVTPHACASQEVPFPGKEGQGRSWGFTLCPLFPLSAPCLRLSN